MSRCIFRKTNHHQGWKLVPLIIIFASAVITLEQEPNNQTQRESDSNQGTGFLFSRKTNFGNNIC
jgi:hypothetical protein